MGITFTTILTSLAVLIAYSTAFAGKISQVKGNKAIIHLDNESLNVGDSIYAIHPTSGKRSGLLKVLQIKNNKAMVEILKGKAFSDGSIELSGSAPSSLSNSSSAKARSNNSKNARASGRSADFSNSFEASRGNTSYGHLRSLKDSYGLLAGLQMNNMTTSKSKAMSGSGFNLGGFYDYIFADSIAVQALVNFEQFNTENKSTDSFVKIGYLSGYLQAKWYPYQSTIRTWVGGGVGLLYALQKQARNSLTIESIASNQVFLVSAGIDYQLNRRTYIPISITYSMFPDSEKAVTDINSIQLRVGWAWNM